MTKQRIKQYPKLRREIVALRERILLAETNDKDFVTETVLTSLRDHPYTQHSLTVAGYGSHRIPRLYARLDAKLAECAEIENYIDAIEDSVIWQLLSNRYIQNKTLGETAALVGYSSSHSERLINAFFRKVNGK
jgi:hypothetical protein